MIEDPNPVTVEQFERTVKDLNALCNEIVTKKRPVYTQGKLNNTLRNFQQNAGLTGMTAGQVLAVYLGKQIQSVMNLLTNPNTCDAEMDTRFADARNYIDIAYVMWRLGKHMPPPEAFVTVTSDQPPSEQSNPLRKINIW